MIFSGLPGTGKTTVAKEVAARLKAVYLRVDTLEQALVDAGLAQSIWELGPAGYHAGYALAADNLRAGNIVVADSVNPLKITRDAWRQVALDAEAPFLDIEMACSDKHEHRRRVENRKPDIPGLALPDWDMVEAREYDPWDRERLILDTARLSSGYAAEAVVYAVNMISSQNKNG